MPAKNEIDNHFDALANSAFDFVERAIISFSGNERISLFLFATGIELFIKARLYNEHWSLIFADIDRAKFQLFEAGDLKTVGADKAHDRIEKIIGQMLPASFAEIRKHRNRIAHFTHGTTEEQRFDIASYQVQGWYDLHQLLRSEWKPFFVQYGKRAAKLERKMKKHRAFLATKFQAVQSDIEKERVAGAEILMCLACKYQAMAVWLVGGSIYRCGCRVCGKNDTLVSQPCLNEDCGHPISFQVSEGAPKFCPSCDETYAECLKDSIDTDPISNEDYYFRTPISCSYCSGYHAVVSHHEIYVCTECFEYDENVGYCEWCSEGQLGGLNEFSALSGCEFCDGRLGWDKD